MAIDAIQVTPIRASGGSAVDFGAIVHGIDLENLNGALRGSVTSSDADFDVVRDALFTHQVLVFKNQGHVTPRAQFALNQRVDPRATSYGHGKTLDAKRSILHPDLKTIPHQPQVQVIGNGFVAEFEGLKDIKLKHPHHRTFHKTVIPDAEDLDNTRFYRWHIDAALYDLQPPVATTLLAVKVPAGRTQTCRYDDGTGDEITVPLGTTAFVSGEKMYDLLSDEDKKFARSTKVEYAPHPYVWMSGAKSRSDGLGMISEGREIPIADLPPIDESKIQILPMCWKNPLTGKLAIQVHPSAVRKLHLADGTVIDDLEKVRSIVHAIQRPGIAPQFVYPHDWEEGDMVIFHNRGTLHSVVGAFSEDEVRLFRQCNVAASFGVEGSGEECA